MQVKQVPEELTFSCAGCVYKPSHGGCAHPDGERGFECNQTRSIYKSFTACSVTKHKEEYRHKIRPLNEQGVTFELPKDHQLASFGATHRANDQATSKGNRKVNKYEQAVLDALGADSPFSMDKRGYTGKELAHHTGHPLNCITPRFAPLRRKGLIKAAARFNHYDVVTGEATVVLKRDKQIVWVLA